MRQPSFLFFLLLLPLCLSAQDWDWLHVFGSFEDDFITEMAVDPQGNVYHTGLVKDSSFIDSIPVVHQGDADIYIARLNKDGVTDWITSAGGKAFDRGDAIVLDQAGNLYVGGFFSDSMLWEGQWYVANGPSDSFIAKYSPEGQLYWIKTFGGSSFDVCYGLELDIDGYLYMAGHFWGDWQMDSLSLSNGSTDQEAVVAKLDTAGTVIWATSMGGSKNDRAYDLAINAVGEVYVTGYFSDTVTIGSDSLFGQGSFDTFIAKLDSNGSPLWARAGTGANSVSPGRIELDAADNPYICGYYRDTTHFGSIELPFGGGSDGYLVKYSPQGALQWARTLSGPGNEYLWDIEFAQSGFLFLSGDVGHLARWDTIEFTGQQDRDVFLGAVDESGNLFWRETQGDQADDSGFGIEWVDNHLYLSGSFQLRSRFGGSSAIASGGFDGHIARRNYPIVTNSIDPRLPGPNLNIYPNPGNGLIWLRVDPPLIRKGAISIYHVNGALVETYPLASGQQNLQLDLTIPAGVYFIQLKEHGKPATVKRYVHLSR
ncbi:MAG: T9SS type A sorting domain-containing protein [Bacteroidota bacterium]